MSTRRTRRMQEMKRGRVRVGGRGDPCAAHRSQERRKDETEKGEGRGPRGGPELLSSHKEPRKLPFWA